MTSSLSRFDAETAEEIRRLTSFPDALEVREDGLYVAEAYKDRSIGIEASPSVTAGAVVFDWAPAFDMDWPGAPNPATAPALPIPFTAAELAAFLLDGSGRGIQQLAGRVDGAPDLSFVQQPKKRWVKEALKGAYQCLADAQAVVGRFEFEKLHRAYALRDEAADAESAANDRERVFEQAITSDEASARLANAEASERRVRAKASVSELVGRAEAGVRIVETNWVAWRKAMMKELLWSVSARPGLTHDQALKRLEQKQGELNEIAADAAAIDRLFKELRRPETTNARRRDIEALLDELGGSGDGPTWKAAVPWSLSPVDAVVSTESYPQDPLTLWKASLPAADALPRNAIRREAIRDRVVARCSKNSIATELGVSRKTIDNYLEDEPLRPPEFAKSHVSAAKSHRSRTPL